MLDIEKMITDSADKISGEIAKLIEDAQKTKGSTVGSTTIPGLGKVTLTKISKDDLPNLMAALASRFGGECDESDCACNEPDCECEECGCYCVPPIKKVRHSDKETTVFWWDGDATTVKCGEGETFDKYTGFMAAVMKKLFGSTSHAKKVRARLDEEELRRVAREKQEAIEAEAKVKRERREKKIIKRLAKDIVIEMKAKKLAKQMIAEEEKAEE